MSIERKAFLQQKSPFAFDLHICPTVNVLISKLNEPTYSIMFIYLSILCLVTKQFFMMFGRQTLPVSTGLFKELKQTTMTTTTVKKMSPNKSLIDSNNSCARDL